MRWLRQARIYILDLPRQVSLGFLKRGELVSPCVPYRCRVVILATLHDSATGSRGDVSYLGIVVEEDGADVG